jgi:hypothetical protein
VRLFADYPNHVGMPLLQSSVPSTGGTLFALANRRRLIPRIDEANIQIIPLIKVLVMTACYIAFDVKPGHKTIIPLRETTTIGRDENNNIVLPDPTISGSSTECVLRFW